MAVGSVAMDQRYRYEILPLDTPDDDPRWESYVNIFRTVFLDARAAPEGVATFRTHRRVDHAVLGMATTEGPGLEGRQPVAAFNVTRAVSTRGAAPTQPSSSTRSVSCRATVGVAC
ncbi:hypothetical protein [Tessaracoccus coleopterorum]|uniref:hypothetical protein n=1 Tax=Tessaracoccus coleopterorum TaxID=2714950 RepID=UPI001E35B8C8|nr:hypothetical protein [Tessaracoccus coleopterorum]